MEIYTLKIRFPHNEDNDPWSRTIEVREDYSLLQLHKYIQKIIEFDDDHLYEFYIGKNPRNKVCTLRKRTKLKDIYPMTGAKLYYLFDFGDCWLFEIKKSKKKIKLDSEIKLPRLIESSGKNPEQYPEWEE